MRLVKDNLKINFLGWRKLAVIISLLTITFTSTELFTQGLNLGIDFSGGALVQIKTSKTPPVKELRDTLVDSGFKGLSIQEYGATDEFLVRIPVQDEEQGRELNKVAQNLAETLHSKDSIGEVEVRRVEFVGPQVGKELREKGFLAIAVSLIAILIYISIRFEFRYGVGALIALFHDVLLTVGVFSLLQKEVSLPVLAALLTIIGYSLNDTIVVFDRVRENRRKYRKRELIDVLNLSVNEMLNRTLMTSLTTAVVLIALFAWGGEVIHDFAFTLLFGVVVGTYSSIFVAAPVVLWMEKFYKDIPQEDSTNNFVEK